MKKNEVRERDWRTVNTRYKRQWDVQGSAAEPYVVSLRYSDSDSDEVFECSCPAWKTSKGKLGQREDCKHILRVQLANQMDISGPIVPSSVSSTSLNVELKGRKFR